MTENNWIFLSGLLYFVSCVWVTAEADIRGHKGFNVFMFCLICTPLLGAIMFHTYKQETEAEEKEKSE